MNITNKSNNTKSTFPKISGSHNLEEVKAQELDNPFYVPADFDFEIFKIKQIERDKKMQERLENANKKIWQKGLKNNMAGRLKKLCNIEDEENLDEEEKDKVSNNLNIIESAKSAIKNRVRQKEPMHKFIQKKREMFLFQMLIDKKREQINQYEEMIKLHERGLYMSEIMLEEDLEAFNKFLEENKNKSRCAIRKAEEATKEKQQKIQKIKELNEKKLELQTKNTSKIETLENLMKYKEFLDKIMPKDDQIKQEKAKNQRKSNKLQRDQNGAKNKKIFESYNMGQIDQNLLDIIEDSDEEFEMYFNKPEQLEDIFQFLEEKNLLLINTTKEREQQVEEIKKKHNQTYKEMEEKKDSLLKQKRDLQKHIDQINEELKKMNIIKYDNEAVKILNMLDEEIQNQYNNFLSQPIDDNDKKELRKKNINQYETNIGPGGIEILKRLEQILESQINNIKIFKQKEFLEQYKKVEQKQYDKRKQTIKQEKEQQRSEEQKRIAELLKKKPKATKRIGRPIMARSMLQDEDSEESVEEVIDEDKLDWEKYFA